MRFLISCLGATFLLCLNIGCTAHVGADGINVSLQPIVTTTVYAPAPRASVVEIRQVPEYFAKPLPWQSQQGAYVYSARPYYQPTNEQQRRNYYYAPQPQQPQQGVLQNQQPRQQQGVRPSASAASQGIVRSQPQGFENPNNPLLPGAPSPDILFRAMH